MSDFQNAWDNYWSDTPAGATQDFGGGILSYGDNGTATWKNDAGQSISFNQESDPNLLAKLAPSFGDVWDSAFGESWRKTEPDYQTDWNAYWDGTTPGQSTAIGSSFVTRGEGDKASLLTDKGSFDFSSGIKPMDLVKLDPTIGTEWDTTYGTSWRPQEPVSAPVPNFYADFHAYFDNTPTGYEQEMGGVKITKNADGTATLTNLTNYDHETGQGQHMVINRNTLPSDIAQFAPGLKAEWDKIYGQGATPPKPFESSNPYNLTSIEVDPNSLIENRITDLLSSDNPLIQQARADALDFAASRGMLNSTMAQNMSEKAAYDVAYNIAVHDADIYSANQTMFNQAVTTSGLLNVEQDLNLEKMMISHGYDLETLNVEQDLNLKKMMISHGYDLETLDIEQGHSLAYLGVQQSFDKWRTEQGMAHDVDLANLERETKEKLVTLDKDLRETLLNIEIEQSQKDAFTNAYYPLSQQYQTEFARIATTGPKFIDADDKMAYLEKLTTDYADSIMLLAQVYNINLPLESFDDII
ncbi:MAG: hypothetical protein U9N86_10310 [Bacteroidota bacterium]|nr:hypothetical protein [Bacteroidota bacterium]